MKCNFLKKQLKKYILHKAPAKLTQEIEEHLSTCEKCRGHLDTILAQQEKPRIRLFSAAATGLILGIFLVGAGYYYVSSNNPTSSTIYTYQPPLREYLRQIDQKTDNEDLASQTATNENKPQKTT